MGNVVRIKEALEKYVPDIGEELDQPFLEEAAKRINDPKKILGAFEAKYEAGNNGLMSALIIMRENRLLLIHQEKSQALNGVEIFYDQIDYLDYVEGAFSTSLIVFSQGEKYFFGSLFFLDYKHLYSVVRDQRYISKEVEKEELPEPLWGNPHPVVNDWGKLAGFLAFVPGGINVTLLIMTIQTKSIAYLLLLALLLFLGILLLGVEKRAAMYVFAICYWIVSVIVYRGLYGGYEKDCAALRREEFLRNLATGQKKSLDFQDIEHVEELIDEEKQKKEMVQLSRENPYIEKMRQLNIAIEDESISNYLDEMERICQNIFIYVEKHSEKESELKNLINYYLPETFSLLENYDELSEKELQTEEITQAREEITETLGMILKAFKNLYKKLIENQASKISVDIKVLKDVLTQHGLTEQINPFELKK